jgi:glutamyl-tRNA reductase
MLINKLNLSRREGVSMADDKKNRDPVDQVMTLALMTAGRVCLVVGAGKTGLRKAQALLDAGARVRLVAPEISSTTGQDNIEWRQRTFQPDDADGIFIAFAATNDPEVNQQVLETCRERGVLCGIVDNGWQDGDFISPAVLKHNGLGVAVSTGGRSCRRARMVKEALGRHIDAVDAADILVLGVDHRTLHLAERENLHLSPDARATLAAMLRQMMAVHGFAILETCNRIELHAVVSDHPEIENILRRALGFDNLADDRHYCLRGFEAFRHTALLASGLLSQNPGEKHIAGQLKTALAEAREKNWANAMLQEWIASALHVSKHIRNETVSVLNKLELEDHCIDFLEHQETADFAKSTLMVLGCGQLGRSVVERWLLRTPQSRVLWGYRRHRPEVPPEWTSRVETGTLDELKPRLSQVGALVCAASCDRPLFDVTEVELFAKDRGTTIVDLGVPRNVSPELPQARPGINLIDLEALNRCRRSGTRELKAAIETAKNIIDQHREMVEKLTRLT